MWWHTRRYKISSFVRNGPVHLNRPGGVVNSFDYCAAEVCASALVKLDTPCSEVVWRVLDNYCINQFPLHFPSRASPCAITFQLEPTNNPSTSKRPCEISRYRRENATAYLFQYHHQHRHKGMCRNTGWKQIKQCRLHLDTDGHLYSAYR